MLTGKKTAVIFFGRMSTGKETQAKRLVSTLKANSEDGGFVPSRLSLRDFDPDAWGKSLPKDEFVLSAMKLSFQSLLPKVNFLVVTGFCNTVVQARELRDKLVSCGFHENNHYPILLGANVQVAVARRIRYHRSLGERSHQTEDDFLKECQRYQSECDDHLRSVRNFYSQTASFVLEIDMVTSSDDDLAEKISGRLPILDPRLLRARV